MVSEDSGVSMVTYNDLMSAIIQKQISIIGKERAISFARKVLGITVNDDGYVTAGGTKETLAALAEEYKKVAGPVALVIIKAVVSSMVKGDAIELPSNLK